MVKFKLVFFTALKSVGLSETQSLNDERNGIRKVAGFCFGCENFLANNKARNDSEHVTNIPIAFKKSLI